MNLLLRNKGLLTLAACLLPLSYASASSINGKYTHNLNVPSSVTEGQNISMSWSAKSTYSGVRFSFVKTGVKAPGASSYTYSNFGGGSGARNFTANQQGQWCFRVRGYAPDNGGFGLFEEKCTQVNPINVQGKVTHFISGLSSSYNNEVNRPITVSWGVTSAYSSVYFNWIKLYVTRPDGSTYHSNFSGSSTGVNPTQPGNWCFKLRGHAPNNGGLGNYNTNSCINIVAPPPVVTGSASLNVPNGALKDNWFSDRDTLSWNVAGVYNASSYRVLVDNSRYVSASRIGNTVNFTTGMFGGFNTNQTTNVQLQACNSIGQCKTVTSATNLVLVKTAGVPFYTTQPKHINQFSAEMVYSAKRKKVENGQINPSSMYRAKRWKFANWNSNWSQTAYDIDLVDVFSTYLYQYDLPENTYTPSTLSAALPNKNKPLFDAFSFVNQEYKVVDGGGAFASCNQMPNSFVEGSPNQMTGNIRECVNDYFDMLFGVKMSRDIGMYDANNANSFEWFAKKNQSMLDALHEASKDGSKDVAFYMVIPSGIVDENTTSKRREMYIDEALEQYALWRAKHGNNSRVKLAGFYQQQESTPNPKGGSADLAKAVSQKRIHEKVKNKINSYSSALTYNSSSYNTLGTYKDPMRFSTACPDMDTTLQDCLIRYTAVRHVDAVALFDNIEFQPNAGFVRFKNRSPVYSHPVVGNLAVRDDTLPSDMEMLHWYNLGLFKPLVEDRHLLGTGNTAVNTKFGIHFEYNTLFSGHTEMKSNYKQYALNGEGYYGDISRYADYMMSEYPEQYLTGPNAIIYDDAGGALYCHIKHAVGQYSGNRACRASDKGYGELELSISDVRSMYAWNNATRQSNASGRKATYKTNTNFDPHNPIQEAKPSVAINIAVNGQNRLDFQSLVRARLTEAYLHSATKTTECTKRPKIRLEFTLSNGSVQSTEKLFPLAELQCDNFLQSKDNIFNKEQAAFKQLIFDKWIADGHANPPSSAAAIQLDIQNMKSSLDEDQWKLFKENGIVIPAGTVNIKLSLMGSELSSTDANKVESILYYRPDYRLYNQ